MIALSMGCFMFFEEDGTISKGVNYDMFGDIAPLVILKEVAAKLGLGDDPTRTGRGSLVVGRCLRRACVDAAGASLTFRGDGLLGMQR